MALRLLVALLLGGTAALLVSCGSSNSAKLIPVADAGPLQSDFETVVQAAQSANGSCQTTEAALLKTEQDFDALPSSVDSGLRNTLRQGIENLHSVALQQCSQRTTSTSTTSTTTPKTTSTDKTTSTATTNTTTTSATTPTTPTTTSTTSPGEGGGTPAPNETPSESGNGAGGGEPAPNESGRSGHTGGSGPGDGGTGNGNGNGNGLGNGAGGGQEAGK